MRFSRMTLTYEVNLVGYITFIDVITLYDFQLNRLYPVSGCI
jgi:hypothetical protein